MTISRIAAIAAAGLVLAACSSNHPVEVKAPPDAASMTVQIGTDGDQPNPTKVSYTCPGSGAAPVCGPETFKGRWEKTIVAPVGTTLWMQVSRADQDSSGKTPNCWISDQSGQEVYIKHDTGICVLRVEQAPPR